jgi:hypothetical protein
MSELCFCRKKSNVKCILNLCKKCCFAKTCSVHINNKKITKYNFICSLCLSAWDKKLLNSYHNYETDETIYYCCECYIQNTETINRIVNKSPRNVFNFDLTHTSIINFDIQIYSTCPCGCGWFSSLDDLSDDSYDDADEMDEFSEHDDDLENSSKIIFSCSDSPVEPATDKSNECNICYINKKNYACIPCGHLCMCKVCASKITEKCPICNIKITHITKIFT